MNGFLLVLPVLFIRFGILGMLSREAIKRAAFFPPTVGKEKVAYWIYQITTLGLLITPFFIRVKPNTGLYLLGLGIYLSGMMLYLVSIVQFANPNQNGLNLNGLYRVSRNPMYVAFFLYFLGCSILTSSWLLLFILLIMQISVHYLILSEERWCIREFGQEYKDYMRRVGRYI